MRIGLSAALISLLAAVACLGPLAPSPASGVAPGDWPSTTARSPAIAFRRSRRSTDRTSASLRQICAYTLPEVAALQAGPVVVGGAMYFSTDTITYAIDAATCAEKWKRVAA